ncbi:MAG: hypothetical protein HZB16_21435 [Armatimonadetes bacterium]|nr:hypothetical protein [Armatimonadota bacterium]
MKSLWAVVLAVVAANAQAVQRPTILVADYSGGRVARVLPDGKVDWEMPAPNSTDVWQLPNGNILYSWIRGVREATPDRKIVWEYKAADNEEVYGCQRLADGNTLVGELASCRAIEVAPDGKTVVKEVKLPATGAQHARYRNLRKLANGHILFVALSEGMVKELDDAGQVVWSVKAVGNPFGASRLPNGNTLVGCGDGHTIQEFDKDGKAVWQVNENDLIWVDEQGRESVVPLRFVGNCQRLPNGNTVVCNWVGHGFMGRGPHLMEITPDKKVVWRMDDHQQFKAIAGACVLPIDGVTR